MFAVYCLAPETENGYNTAFRPPFRVPLTAEVIVSCNSGYAIVGADRFYCQEDRTYSPPPGICLRGR